MLAPEINTFFFILLRDTQSPAGTFPKLINISQRNNRGQVWRSKLVPGWVRVPQSFCLVNLVLHHGWITRPTEQ
jgi:hypothetical protein